MLIDKECYVNTGEAVPLICHFQTTDFIFSLVCITESSFLSLECIIVLIIVLNLTGILRNLGQNSWKPPAVRCIVNIVLNKSVTIRSLFLLISSWCEKNKQTIKPKSKLEGNILLVLYFLGHRLTYHASFQAKTWTQCKKRGRKSPSFLMCRLL